ncbi:hypothetical protein M413DRAFT_32043 [Hebeloma cylindrosporum]|uniref:Uncharacterized protein n=1 Tax=Hebeloma cylindrosporum TaxID=76867 RepID=A0A0C3BX19_HEBCY|nr:hypothetical protein M413DRAFT_32043 [Hebeloma cylindrosporum h7]
MLDPDGTAADDVAPRLLRKRRLSSSQQQHLDLAIGRSLFKHTYEPVSDGDDDVFEDGGEGVVDEGEVDEVSVSTCTQAKLIPIPVYFPPMRKRNQGPARARNPLGAPAPRVKLATEVPDAPDPIPLANSIDVTPKIHIAIGRKPRTDFLDIVSEGEIVVVDNKAPRRDNWCSGCQNGGPMVICETCPRVFCKGCIQLTAKQEHFPFHCPACHYFTEQGKNGIKPYLDQEGKIIRYSGKVSVRELFSTCDMTPVAIIVIALEGMDCVDVMRTVYHHLRSYLFGNVAFVHLDFNFVKKDGIQSYTSRLNSLLALFTPSAKGETLTRFRKIAVCIMTHSTGEGMLHTGPDNKRCAMITEVFEVLFPPRLRGLLQQSIDPTLFLMACGSVVTLNDPLKEIQNFYSNGSFFKQIFAFSQERFQIAHATSFLQDLMLKCYVYNKSKVEAILHQHQSLGAHSDIFLYHERPTNEIYLCERLIWTHEGVKPVGYPVPLQCEACGSIRPWVVKAKPKEKIQSGKNFVVHMCRWPQCSSRESSGISYVLPKEIQWVKEPVSKGDDRGGWVLEKNFDVVEDGTT